MASRNNKVCRLCLSLNDDAYSPLDVVFKKKLEATIPELNLDVPDDFVICSKCKNIVEQCHELKDTFTKNDFKIRFMKTKLGSNDTASLQQIINQPNSKHVCRVCLQDAEATTYFDLNTDKPEKFEALAACIPECDTNLTNNPVICETCDKTLNDVYSLKSTATLVEEKINMTYGSPPGEKVDLSKVANLCRRDEENDFLEGFEVQDEDGTDIFDQIPNAVPEEEPTVEARNGISRKRPLPEDLAKAIHNAKLMKLNRQPDDGLPALAFNRNLLFNPHSTEDSVEEWLGKVDELKSKFGWSDSATIHKVLMRLNGIPELYNWFSSIADIMMWNEWKMKLFQAFPTKDDYHIELRRMFLRKKRQEETYVEYYNAKLEYAKTMRLSDEESVSCILGGLRDIVVTCVGRIGQYKTPEDLLNYFRSCDDKVTIQQAAGGNSNKDKIVPPMMNRPKPTTPKKTADKQCHNCKKMGHIAVMCHKKNFAPQTVASAQNKPSPRRPEAVRPRVEVWKADASRQQADAARQAIMARQTNYQPARVDHDQSKKAPSGIQQPKAKAVKKGRPRCYVCSKFGHLAAVCTAKHQKHSSRSQEARSQCLTCGKFGHSDGECPQIRRASGGQSFERGKPRSSAQGFVYYGEAAQEPYNRNLCLNCYQMGHDLLDCPKRLRNYRN